MQLLYPDNASNPHLTLPCQGAAEGPGHTSTITAPYGIDGIDGIDGI